MTVTVRHEATSPRITVTCDGDLDLAAAIDLHVAVLRLCLDTGREIVFDVSPDAFMDCSVLHVVDVADRRCRSVGGSARFGVLGARSDRLLALVGLERLRSYVPPGAAA